MHESHLIGPIIQGIFAHLQKERAQAVSKVRLLVGEVTGVKEDSFKATVTVSAKGTLLEQAELELSFSPGTKIEVLSFDID